MKLKGRSLLVFALLLFGGYAIFDYYKEKKKETQVMLDARLVTLDYDQIDSIVIEKDLQKISLKRSVDGWSLLEPLQDIADNSVVEEFLKNIAVDRILEVAKEGAEIDWAVFGLAQPLGKVTFTNSAGAKQVFQISKNKNYEQNALARRDNENRVLVVKTQWQDRVSKPAIDYRERHVLRAKIASVDGLQLKNPKGLLVLQRNEGQWQCPSCKNMKLDQNKVRELLQVIADAKASEYMEGAGPQLKALFTLNLKMGDKAWSAEVGQATDFKIYAKVSEPQFLLKLEAGALDKLIEFTGEDLKEVPENKDKKGQPPQDSQKDDGDAAKILEKLGPNTKTNPMPK